MVGAAYGQASPPAQLKIAWKCQSWGALPDKGGILDQDHKLMAQMNFMLNVYNAVKFTTTAQGSEIHKMTSGQRKIIAWLRKEGLM